MRAVRPSGEQRHVQTSRRADGADSTKRAGRADSTVQMSSVFAEPACELARTRFHGICILYITYMSES